MRRKTSYGQKRHKQSTSNSVEPNGEQPNLVVPFEFGGYYSHWFRLLISWDYLIYKFTPNIQKTVDGWRELYFGFFCCYLFYEGFEVLGAPVNYKFAIWLHFDLHSMGFCYGFDFFLC